jgi:hypothetical protein
MSVIKEWKCPIHGTFEGSHPICPGYGCISEGVERVFLTPVGISQGKYSRFEAGLRETANRMNIRDWKSAQREGDSGYRGRAAEAQNDAAALKAGQPVMLWGQKAIQETMGVSMAAQMAAAAAPLNVKSKQPNDPYLRVNNGMRATANTTHVFDHAAPPAELTYHKSDGPK